MTLHDLKTRWLKARIAYHRRKANSFNGPLVRTYKRDSYYIWMRNMAWRHAMKAHSLERKLLATAG
jgi:hypothetical protein